MKRHRRNLWRDDHHQFRGFRVVVKRRGIRRIVYVSDTSAGGRQAALREALRQLDLLETTPPVKIKSRNASNVTGTLGVSVSKETTRGGRPFRRYVAVWPTLSGKGAKRSFSVAYYGEERAFRLAKQARKEGVDAYTDARAREWQERRQRRGKGR